MNKLYLSKNGPVINKYVHYKITTEKENSCGETSLDGKEHNWLVKNAWLVLEGEAKTLFTGPKRIQNGVLKGYIDRY